MEYMATPVSCLPVPTAARIGFDMRVRVRLRISPAKSIQSYIVFAAEIGSKERSLAKVFPQGGPVLGLTRILRVQFCSELQYDAKSYNMIIPIPTFLLHSACWLFRRQVTSLS